MLKNLSSNYKNNWLLTTGFISLFLGFLSLLYTIVYPFSEDPFANSGYYNIPYFLFLVLGIIIAPIWEELSFRGGFTNSKIIKIVSIFGLLGLLIYTELVTLKITTLIYIVLLIVSFYKKSNALQAGLFIGSTVLFALFHLNLEHPFSITTLQGFLFRLAFGFFAIWVCINFSLLKSMLFHAAWNFIFLGFLTISLLFPDETIHHYENDMIKVTWKRVSKSPTYSIITNKINSQTLEAKACDVTFLLNSTKWTLNPKDSIIDFVPTEPFMAYNVEINLKKDTINTNQNLYTLTRQFLSESELILLKTE
ncbi:CPBP family glutamic-type intramembrane protease [Bizionia sp. KMM 8389]